jgi:hypothetical protein
MAKLLMIYSINADIRIHILLITTNPITTTTIIITTKITTTIKIATK